ncbi:MAG: hypothetical protein JNM18_15125 [Planctomycetaceae bacterium]|nr:hypothetical protein [Planctomycetaceae bacterium]
MSNHFSSRDGDKTPVTGGVDLPARLVCALPPDDDIPTDDLGLQAFMLLKTNGDKVALRFRQSDLKAMDDDTKRALISDIQRALGIKSFKKDVL